LLLAEYCVFGYSGVLLGIEAEGVRVLGRAADEVGAFLDFAKSLLSLAGRRSVGGLDTGL
jgi:hypothetical protein